MSRKAATQDKVGGEAGGGRHGREKGEYGINQEEKMDGKEDATWEYVIGYNVPSAEGLSTV